ncbi:PREDICTED: uncharacterized protein LOC105448399 [Wasmannia auropunctata]|uniref:uncharacterized protein LOC105448399 n=1 Tax=Wasmannia auropunctata TaxID=64793 RepID=UPI0005ED9FCD|nr:PREDICTED: uncharacterized protein LOC105448399 [Wasmannia auropunctata]
MAENIGDASILVLYIIIHYGFMFVGNYINQEVIDYSNDIFKKICNTRWYAAPLNIQKCLVIITYRSLKTSAITMCFGLFLPSLQGFATLVSSSLSYFMVIYSVNR